MIFKQVGDGRPYPDHARTTREWAEVPPRPVRLITTKASPIQRHVVETFESYLQQEVDRGNLAPPMPVRDLAYLIVRIIESFIYADLITGDVPDARNVQAAIAALLHADIGS